MNYFFVFQNKTFEQERIGGYLWAPKINKQGTRVSHWVNMKNIKSGDLIFHSYNKKIAAISIAKSNCEDSHQPVELQEEKLWENDGYKVYTEYIILEKSIITSDHKDKILELQPSLNKPFNSLGRGNTGYLFNSSKNLSKYLLKEIRKVQTDSEVVSFIDKILEECSLMDLEEYVILDDNTLLEVLEAAEGDTKSDAAYSGVPQTKKETKEDSKGRKKYPRNAQVALDALKLAGHICEYDNTHKTFIRKRDGKTYTEPHHLIPLSAYNDFIYSLDVEENIVSLCSHCHNLIHYGAEFEIVLRKLYVDRKDMLKSVGLQITYNELKKYYFNS